MISLFDQGFLNRNWGKLALGGGALAVGSMVGDDPENFKSVTKKAMTSTKNTIQDTPKSIPRVIKNNSNYNDFGKATTAWKEKGGKAVMQVRQRLSNIDPDAAVQKGARKIGQIARTTKDYTDRTAGSFRSGYSANIPKLPSEKYDARGRITGL